MAAFVGKYEQAARQSFSVLYVFNVPPNSPHSA